MAPARCNIKMQYIEWNKPMAMLKIAPVVALAVVMAATVACGWWPGGASEPASYDDREDRGGGGGCRGSSEGGCVFAGELGLLRWVWNTVRQRRGHPLSQWFGLSTAWMLGTRGLGAYIDLFAVAWYGAFKWC